MQRGGPWHAASAGAASSVASPARFCKHPKTAGPRGLSAPASGHRRSGAAARAHDAARAANGSCHALGHPWSAAAASQVRPYPGAPPPSRCQRAQWRRPRARSHRAARRLKLHASRTAGASSVPHCVRRASVRQATQATVTESGTRRTQALFKRAVSTARHVPTRTVFVRGDSERRSTFVACDAKPESLAQRLHVKNR
jgi:hypothetical protein